MRPIYGAAVVFAATLAATVGTPGPAEAFFFLPMLMQQQSQPSVNARPDRSPGDNNRWRRNGGDSAKDEATQPAKPSTSTRAKRDEESSNSSSKSGKSRAKSEASAPPPARTRSVRQEPAPNKNSGRTPLARRESPSGGGAPPAAPSAASASVSAPATAHVGTTLGDTYDEKLGEVFQARVDALLKQSN